MRLFRQVLVEALLLALLGSFFGLTLAVAIVRVFKAIGGFAIPRLDAVTVGWPMLAFCFAAAVVAAFLAGFVPALRASRLDATQAAKTFGPTSSLARKERFLLGGVTTLQTSMTMALLVGACLLIQTVVNLANLRPGYETQNILTMSVMKEYRRGMNNDFHRQALQRISALPGVGSAAFIDGLPLTGNQWTAGEVTIVGEPQGPSLAETPQIGACCVTEKYFDTMGMKIVAGRSFQASDIAKSLEEPPAVVIINQAMAQRFFPNENPLGKKIHFRWTPADHPSEIVGIVADSRDVSLTHKPEPELYFSLWQLDVLTKSLVVRTTTDPRGLIGVVRHELRALDPAVAIVDMKTMSQIRAGSAASQTFAMRLLIGFASIGSVLAILGIYGVLSLSTHSRKREMAIRMAVGAQRRDVLGLVLSDGLKLVALGLLAGVALAIVFARVLAGYLFGVGPTDLTTILLVAAVFTAAAMLACYFPARRATNTDPMAALRHD